MKKHHSNNNPQTMPLKTRKSAFLPSLLTGLVLCSPQVAVQAASPTPPPAYTIKVIGGKASQNLEQSRQNTMAGSGKMLHMAGGGVIWLSNDPATITPVLSVSAPVDVEMGKGQLKNPVSFRLNSNYASFIDSWELAIYDAMDDDERHPLATLKGKEPLNSHTLSWDGKTASQPLTAGTRLKYILTVRDKAGHMDQTAAQQLNLRGPGRHFNQSEQSTAMTNQLARQTIPVHGARVRIQGSDIPQGARLTVDGEAVSVSDNRFLLERLLPEGQHQFALTMTDRNGNTRHGSLNTRVTGHYMFMVGLADITVGEGKVSGNLETISDGDRYLGGDLFVDGRLAFYLKGKIKGKYLMTAQMDTGTADIEELFDDIHKKDPQSVFRRLDPDKYYPVYGDDSTIVDDTNSQGKLYVRVDRDKSSALWGNFNTAMTGAELSGFNRSLYGAKLSHKSTRTTATGEHKNDLTVFASEAQTAYGHNRFLGTGGSLYYLKDTDIVVGSEKVWVEIRQPDSERAVAKVVLEEGKDYQIDDFQGRIILNQPLMQIADRHQPSLVKDTPLDGNDVFLMVDYEYVPDGFDSDKASYGARGKSWLTEHLAIGGTMVHENRNNEDYDLKGIDITLQKRKGTYLIAEYAETESLQSNSSFTSEDGGISFSTLIDEATPRNTRGSAFSLEGRANLQDLTGREGSVGAWYKERDAGFSNARINQGVATTEAGVETITQVNERLSLSSSATLLDKEGIDKTTTASVQGDYRVNDKTTLSAELQYVKEEDQSATAGTPQSRDGEGTLAAFKVGYDVNEDVNLYLIAQGTLEQSGSYESNDLLTLGANIDMGSRLDLAAEISSGDRGDSARLGVNYRLNDKHSVYSNYTLSDETAAERRGVFTIGQRYSVNDRTRVFTEHQFTHENTQHGTGNTLGIDYDYNDHVTLEASAQVSRLDKDDGGIIDRDAFSVGLRYDKNQSRGSSRVEYRKDKGANEETGQWVTTNRLNYRINPDLRLQAKLNYSETRDLLSDSMDAKFAEAGLGFGYRPVNHDRLNMLGKLTWIYDLQPESQSQQPDQQSLIASLENSYQLNQKWEVGGKVAHRLGKMRLDRDNGQWEKNDATLVAARARYHLTHNWDGMAEYHWLQSDESGETRHGAMVAVDRHIGKNLKLGIGYNFTDFDDDLGNSDGDAKGWFVNMVGKY